MSLWGRKPISPLGVDILLVGTKDENIHPLNLSEQEKLDLVEFLKALTGDPLPSSLTQDTSKH